MIKRKFGMVCLNISQGRYGGYSHKNLNAYDLAGMDTGIDRFRTFNDVEIIGIQDRSQGFANTVMFYDALNGITLAMTHMNNLNGYKVGNVYHSGDTIYYEGKKAPNTNVNITGNHIHLEIGKGKQTGKVKINGTWQLKDLINIEDYFYIDDNYTSIKDDNGYKFSHGQESMVMSFNKKHQLINWNGKRVHVYKLNEKMDIGFISAKEKDKPQWQSLQPLDEIDCDETVCCKINCGYFVMTNGDDHGQHLGVEQGFNCDNAPKEDGYIAVWIDNQGAIHWGRSKDYFLSKKDVKCAFTPFCVNLANGKDEDDYSYNFGDKRKLANTQTCLMQCADGSYAFVVFADKVTPYQTRNFAKEYGCTFNCCLDSGGSSQMIVDGNKKVYTGRRIANALIAYVKKDVPEPPQKEPTQEPSELELLRIENEELRKLNEELRKLNEALKNANEGLGDKLKDAYKQINEWLL